MEEIRKNNTVKICLTNQDENSYISGVVTDFSHDRVKILISNNSIESAKKIKELDELKVVVDTHFGLKTMISLVISELDKKNSIVIENSPASSVEQKRKFARVVSEFKFNISKNDKIYHAVCKNISAGGVAFLSSDVKLDINQVINVHFFEIDFEKDIFIQAKILKADNAHFVAKFIDIKQGDEDKIMKYVFRIMAQS